MEIWDKVLIYLGHAMAFPQFYSMEFYHTNAAVHFLYYFRAEEILAMTLVQSMAIMTNGLPTKHKIRSEKQVVLRAFSLEEGAHQVQPSQMTKIAS